MAYINLLVFRPVRFSLQCGLFVCSPPPPSFKSQPLDPELMTIEILKHCDSEKTLHQSLRYVISLIIPRFPFNNEKKKRFLWNADLWLKFFNECVHKNRGMLLALRKLVQIGLTS